MPPPLLPGFTDFIEQVLALQEAEAAAAAARAREEAQRSASAAISIGSSIAGVLLLAAALFGVHRWQSRRAALLASEREARASTQKKQDDEAKAAPVRAAVQREEATGVCSFYFVHRSFVLQPREQPSLPVFQELRKQKGAIRRVTIPVEAAYRGDCARKYLAVSHRWLSPDHPDEDGTQMQAVQAYLLKHPDVEWVWFE